MRKCKIGLLNFSNADCGDDHVDAIQELLDYAQLADQLGYSRFWLGEHYLYKQQQCWTNPEMLVPIIAASTNTIKVGIAGSLISVHLPLDVATNFKLLANLFPGRIDLGLAKGGVKELGHDVFSLPFMLAEHDPAVLFSRNARALADFLHQEKKHVENGLVLPPAGGTVPDIWLLGSSYRNIEFAVELQANFSRSLFHMHNDPAPAVDQLHEYKERYFERYKRKPAVTLAVAGCCHHDLSVAKGIVDANINSGAIVLDTNGIICGSPRQFCDQLYLLQEKYNIDEFILLQLYNGPADRLKGIELIARELDI